MKYKILKVLDVTGFTFLSPVVRLCYGEEPRTQLRDIGRFIVVPVIAFLVFLGTWRYLAPKHKTKSGEVPTPQVVYDAATDIWTFHSRENTKAEAYTLVEDERESKLAEVKHYVDQLAGYQAQASEMVAVAEVEKQADRTETAKPLEFRYKATKSELDGRAQKRETNLCLEARSLPTGDAEARATYLEEVKRHVALKELETQYLQEVKTENREQLDVPFPPLVDAKETQTAVAEERQFMQTLTEQLGKNNRSVKVAAAQAKLDGQVAEFMVAQGDAVFPLAVNIVKAQTRIAKITQSSYAKPWTLPDQILRSLACVFLGFLLSTFIAIPIGVLCGLSETFMAATTPFIALLKPVSPIVWLPIALIIVGGFIPDPDKHWLITWLAEIPLIGWMKINPAFIASAVTVALCSLWPTLVNTALGVASIDKDHMNVARVLKLGFWSRLFKIVIPSALPLIFAGLRISLGVGWMVLIAAELLSSSEGIGKFVWDQFNNGASDSFAKMFVVVFIVGALGFMLDRIMVIFQRLVSFDGTTATA